MFSNGFMKWGVEEVIEMKGPKPKGGNEQKKRVRR